MMYSLYQAAVECTALISLLAHFVLAQSNDLRSLATSATDVRLSKQGLTKSSQWPINLASGPLIYAPPTQVSQPTTESILTGSLEPIIMSENTLVSSHWDHLNSTTKTHPDAKDKKNQNKIGLQTLIRRINYPGSEQTKNKSDFFRDLTDEKTQWLNSATTTVRPIYDQIPRPLLFEDDNETDSFDT